jgi:hypothetical protein
MPNRLEETEFGWNLAQSAGEWQVVVEILGFTGKARLFVPRAFQV